MPQSVCSLPGIAGGSGGRDGGCGGVVGRGSASAGILGQGAGIMFLMRWGCSERDSSSLSCHWA